MTLSMKDLANNVGRSISGTSTRLASHMQYCSNVGINIIVAPLSGVSRDSDKIPKEPVSPSSYFYHMIFITILVIIKF